MFFSNTIYADIPKKYLSLKNKIVNVRYGPSSNSPIKYVYKKIDFPIKQIDKKENFRRIIDIKKRYDVLSDLNFEINKIFNKEGITIPFPQRDIHIKDESKKK